MARRRSSSIDNSQDTIDSRDVIERISELESALEDRHNEARQDWQTQVTESEVNPDAETPHPDDEPAEDFEEWLKVQADNSDDEAAELVALRAFAEEASDVADWQYGEAFIRASYFEEYARDLAEDLYGKELSESRWPFDCIDWERAADELLHDYSGYELDGVTYYARS